MLKMKLGLVKYHILALAREPITMFLGFGLPFVILFMQSNLINEFDNALGLDILLGILITMAITVLCFNDSAYSHAYTRQIKFLRRLRMTPVKSWHYIVTGIVSRIAVLIVFVATMIAVLTVNFGMDLTDRNWLFFAVIVIMTFIMFYLIGMFIANMLKNAKMSQSLSMAVYFLFLTLGGIMFPIEIMPDFLQSIASWLPTAFSISTLQNAWTGTDIFYGHYFIAMVITTVIFGVLSVKFFKYE